MKAVRACQVLSLVLLLGTVASANERRFTYTYESAVLPQGARELELWTTSRLGRDGYYSRIDQRLELEVGLTDRLMTALYWNGKAVAAPDAAGDIAIETEWGSFSSEWKYKLLDPVADALGLAIYGELTAATDELELEAKLILDKRVGRLLLAGNLVVEYEFGFGATEVEREAAIEVDLALTYFLNDRLSLGLEARNHNLIVPDGGLVASALFAGPVIAFSEKNWWVALTFQAQLPAISGATPGYPINVDEHERFHTRLLFSFHL
jgi:hypothetical protein